jgi:hypothetical protein
LRTARLLALLLLRALDVLQPWRLTAGIDTRDTWRVCAIATFFPWTRWRWRAKVPFFAERYVNRDLEEALKAPAEPPPDHGFKPIVAPLLAAMGFADAKLIAARMYAFADRSVGKLRMATRARRRNSGPLSGRHRFGQRSGTTAELCAATANTQARYR